MSERLPPRVPVWAERLVRAMDDGLRVPGTNLRFGLDPILGLIPGVGDVLGALSALSLFALALSRGVPRAVLLRMAFNVGLDALLGALPILGDLFDATWKANRRNLVLIERAGQNGVRSNTLRDWLFVAGLSAVVLGVLCLPLVLLWWLLQALWPNAA